MSVELDPVELGFKRKHSSQLLVKTLLLRVTGPFQQEVSQTLRLKNPHSDPVAFKVSTH